MESVSRTNGFVLKRYTELPFLLDLLQNKRLTVLSPEFWDDKNDSYFIDSYRRKKSLKSVLALCFTEESETYHHWKVFSPGLSGVCIDFDKDSFVEWAGKVKGLKFRCVEYKKIDAIRKSTPEADLLPFMKRHPYRHEKEFRIIYEAASDVLSKVELKLNLNLIRRIVINPWLPKSVIKSIEANIHQIKGCEKMLVHRTTLVSNDEWRKIADNV
jgi:hypothetical protein